MFKDKKTRNDIILGVAVIVLAAGIWLTTELLKKEGEAIAREAIANKVSLVLGPGANIKRSPLCGRNFEYFSEDPILAGELAASFIQGVQSMGVGTSLKHFCANSQETRRMTCDSVVDERALREIYLTAFEIAVKKAQPWTVMNSYNKINGFHGSENKHTQLEILRDEWGFDGVVISDYNAVCELMTHGVAENKKIAKDVYYMTLTGDTSFITAPGQFINIDKAGK